MSDELADMLDFVHRELSTAWALADAAKLFPVTSFSESIGKFALVALETGRELIPLDNRAKFWLMNDSEALSSYGQLLGCILACWEAWVSGNPPVCITSPTVFYVDHDGRLACQYGRFACPRTTRIVDEECYFFHNDEMIKLPPGTSLEFVATHHVLMALKDEPEK